MVEIVEESEGDDEEAEFWLAASTLTACHYFLWIYVSVTKILSTRVPSYHA